jgi:hypothetical protein
VRALYWPQRPFKPGFPDQITHPTMKYLLPAILWSVGFTAVPAAITFVPHSEADGKRAWAFEAGVALITSNNVEDFMSGRFRIESGPAGGEIYTLTASRRLGELHWHVRGNTFRPQVEMPLTLEIVDENGRAPFLDYNASVMVRWIDFPWNDKVRTSFAMGVGLSYSEKVYLMDIQRHPNDSRSHLKFNWPIQFTFASPDHPDHLFMLMLVHQSGGRTFDKGGVNSLGLGYRRDF